MWNWSILIAFLFSSVETQQIISYLQLEGDAILQKLTYVPLKTLPQGRRSSVEESLAMCGSFFSQLLLGSHMMAAGTAFFLTCPNFGVPSPATRVRGMQKLCRTLLQQYYLLLQHPKTVQKSRLT